MTRRVLFAVGSTQLIRSGRTFREHDKLAHGIHIIADVRAPHIGFPNP